MLPSLASTALLAALLASPGPEAVPAELTFEDAVRIARERSPDLAIADAAVAAARAQERAAGALPNPSAAFTMGWSSQCSDPGCDRPVYGATLGDQGAISFLVTGQRGLAVDAAAQGVLAAEAARADAQRGLEFDVKRQFVAASVSWRGVEYGEREAARAREAVELARRRRVAGEIPPGDLSRLELLKLQIEQGIEAARLGFQQERLQLAQLLGIADGAPTFTVVVGPTATATPPARLAAATLPELLARARERRPDLAAARAQLESARSAAALARRRVIPAFQLQAQYAQQGQSGSWFTPPTAGFGIALPLPVLYQQQGEIGAADATVSAAEASLVKVEARVATEVASSFAAFQATRRAAQRAEEQLVGLSRDVRESVSAEYARGAASLLDYLDTQRVRISNEVEYLGVLRAFWVAVFDVERAVGERFVP
jgi:cobalt-zinc-cadmium efflux system outer membrane protein